MNWIKYIIILVCLFNNRGMSLFGQANRKLTDIHNYNQIDRQGRYQGFWKVAMPDDMGHTSNRSFGFYFNNKKIGTWVLRDYRGSIISENIYYDTIEHKIQRNEYYANQVLKSRGFVYPVFKKDSVEAFDFKTDTYRLIYIDSIYMKQEKWEYYFQNGILESTGEYENDTKRGIWRYYNEKGELVKTENF